MQGEALEEELAFWAERLAGLPTLELPTDRPRPPAGNHRGDSVIRTFPPGLRQARRTLPRARRVAFHGPRRGLQRGPEPVHGPGGHPGRRPDARSADPELEGVVGLFVNMVVLRCDLSGTPRSPSCSSARQMATSTSTSTKRSRSTWSSTGCTDPRPEPQPAVPGVRPGTRRQHVGRQPAAARCVRRVRATALAKAMF